LHDNAQLSLLVTIPKKSSDQDIIASVNESQFEFEHVSIDMLKQSMQKIPQNLIWLCLFGHLEDVCVIIDKPPHFQTIVTVG